MNCREIIFGDTFSLARIVKKMSIKNILKNIDVADITKIKDEKKRDDIQIKKGVQIFLEVFSEAGEAEIEIKKFVADFAGCKIDDVHNWKLKDIKEFIQKAIEVNSIEDIRELFTSAGVSK